MPPTHLSRAEFYESIVSDMALKPMKKMLSENKKLSYFFYGGLFYRFSVEESEKNRKNINFAPIAFVFKPSALTNVYRYFPFDTGVLERHSNEFPVNLKLFEVDPIGDIKAPGKIVYGIFSTNDNYLNGDIHFKINFKPLQSELERIYNGAQEELEADWRVSSIECQFDVDVSLKHLDWISYPDNIDIVNIDAFTDKYDEQFGPDSPELDPYPYKLIYTPNDLAGILRERVENYVKRRYCRKRRKNG